MNTRHVYLASPSDKGLPELIRRLSASGKFLWVYLGSDYCRMLELEQGELAGHTRLSISNALQDISRKLRQPYIDWIGELGIKRNSLPWWAGSIADKGPHISSLFTQFCYLRIAFDLIEEYKSSGLLLVVENPGLFRQLAENRSREVLLLPSDGKSAKIAGSARKAVELVRFYVHYLIQVFRQLRMSRLNNRPKDNTAGLSREAVLVTYVDDNLLLPDGQIVNRYLPVLPGWLAEKGYRVSWLPFIYQWKKPWSEAVRRARSSREPLYFLPDYLRFYDYLWAVFRTITHWRPRRHRALKFEGLAVGEIMKAEESALRRKTYVPDRLVFWPGLRRLSRERPGISVFIFPFENQAWEKIFCAAVRRFFPKAKLIGFQHSTISPAMLNFFPGSRGRERDYMPHQIVCGGREFLDMLRKEGHAPESLRLGCALRYARISGELFGIPPVRRRREGKPRVLVAFSISAQESAHILHSAIEAFGTNTNLEIVLKPHPTCLTAESLLSLLPEGEQLPDHFTIVHGQLSDLLPETDLLLYNSSSAVYEALALGIPVLHLVPETMVDLDPLTSRIDSPAIRAATGPEKLKEAVMEMLELSEENLAAYAELGRKLVSRFFIPVTEEGLRAFLPDPNE